MELKEDKIISALIGLVGACNNNPKTANTDRVVIKALALPVICGGLDDEGLSEMINEIYTEKNAVAPNCASCTAPCGNTADYDMRRIYEAEAKIRDAKMELLSKCKSLAACIYRNKELEKETQPEYMFFYKALSYISFDIEKEPLLELVAEAEAQMNKMGDVGHDTENHKN